MNKGMADLLARLFPVAGALPLRIATRLATVVLLPALPADILVSFSFILSPCILPFAPKAPLSPLAAPPVLRNLPLAMASALFTPEQKEIILRYPITDLIDAQRDRLPKDLSSFDQDVDEGT